MANLIFGTAVSGLNAAQAGLATTSHNVANVNTPGFSRQEAVQTTAPAQKLGSGFLGSGVEVATVRRAYSEFLEIQARGMRAEASAAEELGSQLDALENLLADPAAGLAPALNDFFQGLHEVAANPADSGARQALLGRAESLAARFHNLDASLSSFGDGVNRQIATSVGTINAYAARIADLNLRILATAAPGQTPNDLLDQRDALLQDLNREIGASAVAQSDGTVNVFLSSGQALVVGSSAYVLGTFPDPESPQNTAVGLRAGATLLPMRAADLQGGRLGALLEFRDTALPAARNALGRIAMAIAAQVNDQHQLGMDLGGLPGTTVFSAGAPAAAARPTNAGTAQLSAGVSNYAALGISAYRALWDGANWQITRLADGASWTFGSLPQTVDGVAIALASGTPAAGDSFRIEPTAAGAAGFALLVHDPARIAAAAPVRTASAPANTGRAVISAGSVNAPPPPDPDLLQTVTITFTGPGAYSVSGAGTGNPSGLAYVPGGAITYNGWTATISGTPAAGDTFTVLANSGGMADNRNALALAALQLARSLDGGGAGYAEAYSQIVSDAGSRAREAQIAAEAATRLAGQADAARQSVAGVNLDEEAANLLRYQQSYQASAKVFAIAKELFDTLIALGGR